MKSLTQKKRYDMIDASNSTSRYMDDLLNKDNIHFEQLNFNLIKLMLLIPKQPFKT